MCVLRGDVFGDWTSHSVTSKSLRVSRGNALRDWAHPIHLLSRLFVRKPPPACGPRPLVPRPNPRERRVGGVETKKWAGRGAEMPTRAV